MTTLTYPAEKERILATARAKLGDDRCLPRQKRWEAVHGPRPQAPGKGQDAWDQADERWMAIWRTLVDDAEHVETEDLLCDARRFIERGKKWARGELTAEERAKWREEAKMLNAIPNASRPTPVRKRL